MGVIRIKIGGAAPIPMAAAYAFALNVAISHYWNPKMWQAVTEKNKKDRMFYSYANCGSSPHASLVNGNGVSFEQSVMYSQQDASL